MDREDLKITNGLLVTPGGIVKGGLTVREGRISALGLEESLPAAAEQIDARGLVVLPGLIDPHLHLGLGAERGQGEEKFASDIETESVSAAVGGVTTIISTALFSGGGKGSILPIIALAKELGGEHSLVDFKLTSFVMNNTHIEEIPALVEEGVSSFKFLMSYKGEEGRQVGAYGIDWGFAYRGFEAIAQVTPPALAMVHPEAAEVIDVLKATIAAEGREDLGAWTDARPPVTEAMDVANAGLLALQTGVDLYVPHVSSRLAMKAVEFTRQQGGSLSAETCPHYLTLTKDAPIGNHGKVNPPLRDWDDVESLWEEMEGGNIDTIGSDHATYQRRHKAGSLWDAMPGFGGVGTILPLLITHGVKKGRLPWERFAKVTSENAARLFGIYPAKGALAVGSDADLVIVDPDYEWVLSANALHSASDFSIYEGHQVMGRATMTFVRGVKVAESGAPAHEAPHGRYVYLA